MKLIKKQSKKTYKNKEGKEVHYYNFILCDDDGREIYIKPCFDKDYNILNFLSIYEGK